MGFESDSFCTVAADFGELEESLQEVIDRLEKGGRSSDKPDAATARLAQELSFLRATLAGLDIPPPEILESGSMDLYHHSFTCTCLLVGHLEWVMSMPPEKRLTGLVTAQDVLGMSQTLRRALVLLEEASDRESKPASTQARSARKRATRDLLRQIRVASDLLRAHRDQPVAVTHTKRSAASEGCTGLVRSLYHATLRLPAEACLAGLRKSADARKARRRSRDIDTSWEGITESWTACDIVIYGADGHVRQSLMRSLEAHCAGDQVVSARELRRAALQRVRSVMEATEASFKAELGTPASVLIDIISQRLPDEADDMDGETARMIEELWKTPSFRSACAKRRGCSLFGIDECLTRMTDLLAGDYIPRHTDHTFLLRQRGSTTVSTLSAGDTSINLFDGEPRGSSGMGKHGICSVAPHEPQPGPQTSPCLSFVFDLATYAQVNAEHEADDPARYALQRSLDHFGLLVELHPDRPVFLFLVNVTSFAFRCQLVETPLSQVSADYTGGEDPTAASEFILARFRARNGTGRLYCKVSDILDASNLTFLFRAIKEQATILEGTYTEAAS